MGYLLRGLNEDDAESVTTDNAGNIFITGFTASTSGISTPVAYQIFYGGGAYDAFLAKFNFCDLPDAGVISGPSALCVGVPITLTDTAFGGTWSASNGHAVVAGGLVTGITSGVDTISYTVAVPASQQSAPISSL